MDLSVLCTDVADDISPGMMVHFSLIFTRSQLVSFVILAFVHPRVKAFSLVTCKFVSGYNFGDHGRVTFLLNTYALSIVSLSRSASLKVTPNWSQFFEYEHISLSCERIASGEWTVWRSPAKKGSVYCLNN